MTGSRKWFPGIDTFSFPVVFGALAGVLFFSNVHGQAVEWFDPADRVSIDLSGVFYTLEGEEILLGALDSRVTLLNFWATWCGPCRAEMPSISDLHDAYAASGLKIIAVTDEDPEYVAAYIDRNPYPFTILIDRGGQLAERLRIWAIPWTLVLDKNDKLAHFYPGAKLWNTPEVLTNVERLLNE